MISFLLPIILGLALFLVSFLSIAAGHPFLMVLILLAVLLAVILWRRPTLGIFLLVFSLPFERLGSYDVAGFTVRASQIFLLCLSLILLFRVLSQKERSLPSFPYFFPLAFFLLANIFSLVNSENLSRSVLVLSFTLFTSLLSFVVPYFVRSEKTLRTVFFALILTTSLVCVFGIYQFLGDMAGLPPAITGLRDLYTKDVLGFPRIQSTALEPLYFANFLLLPIALLFSFFIRGLAVQRFGKILPIFILFLAILNLILTVSRGGYMAVSVTFFVIIVFFWKKFFTLRNTSILFVVLAAGLLIAFRLFSAQDTVQDFIAHTFGIFQGASFDERVETFQIAESAVREHPFVGIGVGGFGPRAARHPYVQPEGGWPIVNNEFLELLTEVGFVGLISFVFFLLMLFFRSLKALRNTDDFFMKTVHVALISAFAGVIFQYQTFSTLYIMHVWFLFGLMIAVQNISLKNENLSTKNQK